ncbi:monovalent cation/H(+) antiporter subunit G [Mumia sp. zg.B53]|uniref:monovalent cation/H(+) antiporter subunit G n=1 Tax=unclassified Mumia TaxID=2621872 RepID=UPI001C6EB033|nr:MULTISPECIES: monovalent cation/H(+) antiporter subunit G [unclassified Mumia]MBW9207260.1 monovalent cation/H(+) antiporter subunit G [Mumia sp. zg.B17]MBW9210392.1 monovalent cation/H(+) antiporter subunit G [Mumia sp. zg.B21]MBW9215014.1 monovalent cation/H(+) antiporter subunit G [Mumia sp. zg.B53]MDD9348714.1 monovalent cation/H(+) antiporter subunit G [Mumia sp.]
MNLDLIRDIASAFCLLVGAFMALIAAIGIIRFNNLFSRMHAATKPQVLGLLLILIGIALRMEHWSDLGLLVLVAAFQLLTAPVAAHMLGRAVYRTGDKEPDERLVDERLSED